MSEQHDILVIGGGIAGASAAAELAADGADVCVLEAEQRPDYHSTGRSAAIYIQHFGNRVIRGLTAASRAFFDQPPAGFSEHPLVTPRGVMTVASESQMAAFHAVLEEASGMYAMNRKEALQRVPVLRDDWLAAAALEPNAMDIDVNAVHTGFQRQLKKRGGRIICDARVQALERNGDAWRVQTPAGEFTAPVIINAAGAWADAVAQLAGVRPLGLVPCRRTAVIIDPPAGVDVSDWPMVNDAQDNFYFKPESGKLLLSPVDATPDRPGDAQPEDLDVAIAVDHLEHAVNFEVDRIEHRWAGLRTFAHDGALVIGWDPEVDGFFWVAAQGGYGIQTSPMASRTAASLFAGKGLPQALLDTGVEAADLAPDRLAKAGADSQQS